jgi:hypothetical protein
MPLTLKQMTAALSRVSPETSATLNRQIRVWTDAGILPVVGGLRTGSGRVRLYEDDAPLLAALAIELTRFGASIGFVQEALQWLDGEFKNKNRTWGHQVKAGEIKSYLIVMPSGRGKELEFACMRPDHLGDYIGGPDFAAEGKSLVIINLHALWAKLS